MFVPNHKTQTQTSEPLFPGEETLSQGIILLSTNIRILLSINIRRCGSIIHIQNKVHVQNTQIIKVHENITHFHSSENYKVQFPTLYNNLHQVLYDNQHIVWPLVPMASIGSQLISSTVLGHRIPSVKLCRWTSVLIVLMLNIG